MKLHIKSVLLFTANRYVCYAMNFVRGILIAKFMGPYIYGVWSLLTLLQSYMIYSGFGLQFATSIELSTGLVPESSTHNKIINVAFTLTLLLSFFLCILTWGGIHYGSPIFVNSTGQEYLLMLAFIAGLYNIQSLLINVYRVYRKLSKIAFSEITTALISLLVVFFFKDRALIWASLVSMMMSMIIGISVFMINSPFTIKLSLDARVCSKLLSIGIPLLIYNSSFILITMIGRTIIGLYYPIEIMGYYSFANAISSTSVLAVDAIAWIFFPTILSKTHEGVNNELVLAALNKIKVLYITAVTIIILIIIIMLPVLLNFLPIYKPAQETLTVLLLSQALLSISFADNCLALARKKQVIITAISLLTVGIISGLSMIAAVQKLDFLWVAVSVFIGTFVYNILQGYFGYYLLNKSWKVDIKELQPWRNVFVILIVLSGALSGHSQLLNVVALMIFTLIKRRQIKELYVYGITKLRPTEIKA